MERYLKEQIDNGLIAKDGKPLKCNCGCIEFTNVDIHYCPWGTEEYAVKCNDCNKIIGRWAYGSWQV